MLAHGLFIVKQGLQTGVNIVKVLLFYIDQKKKQKNWVWQTIKGPNKNNFNFPVQTKQIWSQLGHVARHRRHSRAIHREKCLLIMKSGKGSLLLDHCKQIAFSVSPTDFYFTFFMVLHSHLNEIRIQKYSVQWFLSSL